MIHPDSLRELCKLIAVEVQRHVDEAFVKRRAELAATRKQKYQRRTATFLDSLAVRRYQAARVLPAGGIDVELSARASDRAAAAVQKARQQGRRLSFRDAYDTELREAKKSPTRYQKKLRPNPRYDSAKIAREAATIAYQRRARGESCTFNEVFDELMRS
jgi:hypothetical protein